MNPDRIEKVITLVRNWNGGKIETLGHLAEQIDALYQPVSEDLLLTDEAMTNIHTPCGDTADCPYTIETKEGIETPCELCSKRLVAKAQLASDLLVMNVQLERIEELQKQLADERAKTAEEVIEQMEHNCEYRDGYIIVSISDELVAQLKQGRV